MKMEVEAARINPTSGKAVGENGGRVILNGDEI